MTRKFLSFTSAFSLLILLGGCSTPYQRSEFYFGLSRHAAGDISPADWQAFVDEVITPRFPLGLTVVNGDGQWQSGDGSLAKEKSKVVIIVHECSKDDAKKLDEIREIYKQRFSQESVLEVDESVRAKF